MNTTMRASDSISGALGEAYATIEGRRYHLITFLKVEATVEKNKAEVPILGRTGKGNKANGWKGTGSATLHYCTPMFREFIERYKNTGEDFYFELQIINDDPSSASGKQITILKDVNIDGAVIAKLDVEADYLDEEINFTFDDFMIPTKFKLLKGM